MSQFRILQQLLIRKGQCPNLLSPNQSIKNVIYFHLPFESFYQYIRWFTVGLHVLLRCCILCYPKFQGVCLKVLFHLFSTEGTKKCVIVGRVARACFVLLDQLVRQIVDNIKKYSYSGVLPFIFKFVSNSQIQLLEASMFSVRFSKF